MLDDPFQSLQDDAAHQRAMRGAADLAKLVCHFRANLIVGGVEPDTATEMMREYFDTIVAIRRDADDADDAE